MAGKDWDALVRNVPTTPFEGDLKRCVAQLTFNRKNNYLFTSGKRNRCNPSGVFCIYMSEDRSTALAEYDKYFTDLGDDQPMVLYTGFLRAAAIIDLGDPEICKHFGLNDADFFTAFRTKGETNLEKLGAAISRQTTVVRIRFPSDAQFVNGKNGFNLVIFRDSIATPDSLRIKGPEGNILDDWPE